MPKQIHKKIKYCDLGGYYYYDASKAIWFYEYRRKAPDKINTIRKQLQAKTENLLKEKISSFHEELKNPKQNTTTNSTLTLSALCDKWFKAEVQNKVALKSVQDYERNISYIKDLLGDKQINTIDIDEIEQFQFDLSETTGKRKKGLSPRTVNAVISMLKRIFMYGLRHKFNTINPVIGVKPLKNDTKEKTILDEEQVNKMLSIAKQGDYIRPRSKNGKIVTTPKTEYSIKMFYLFISLALGTGMRLNELLGLRHSDIDFENNKIHVQYQLKSSTLGKLVTKAQLQELQEVAQKTKNKTDIRAAENADPFQKLKTKNSIRSITILPETMKDIHEFIEYQQNYAKDHSTYNNEWDLLFTNTVGKPVDESNIRNRCVKRLVAACNFDPKFTPHSTRHTHASLLLLNKLDICTVSHRLGHADPSVTLKIYAHVLPNSDEDAAKTWSSIIQKNNPGKNQENESQSSSKVS